MTPLKAHPRSHPYRRPAGKHHIRDFARMEITNYGSGGACVLRPAERQTTGSLRPFENPRGTTTQRKHTARNVLRVIRTLMDQGDAENEGAEREGALGAPKRCARP